MNDVRDFRLVSDSLSDWIAFASASAVQDDRGLVLSDEPTHGPHVLQLRRDQLAGKRIRLTVAFRAAQGGTAGLLVHHWGGADVLAIANDGTVLHNWFDAPLAVRRDEDGTVHVEVEYPSSVDNILLGTFLGTPDYVGTGAEQIVFTRLEASVTAFNLVDPADMVSFIDVGAGGGLPPIWTPHMEMLDITLIEPADEQAAFLKRFRYPRSRLIQAALFDRRTRRDLHIARLPGCSSLLEPDFGLLGAYSAAPCFEILRQETVKCTRFDFNPGDEPIPSPEFIKIDTQGVEYEVLQGFGDTLNTCLAIELEAHFYPIYKNQRLLGDIVQLLARFDLYLRLINPIDHFDGDVVEADVLFSRRPSARLSDRQRRKLQFIESHYPMSRNRPLGLLNQIGLS